MSTDPQPPATNGAAPPAETLFVRLMPGLFVVLWSTGYIGARAAATGADPLTFLTLRFVLAGTLLLVAALVGGAQWPRQPRSIANSIIAGALMQGGYLGGVFWAVYHGLPAGIAALIVALQPLLTGLLAGPVLGETVTRAHWLGLVVGLLGLGLVIGPKIELTGAGITPVTVGVTLFAVLSIVLGSIWQKAHAAHVDLRAGTFLQYVGGAIVVGIGALASENLEIDWTGEVIFAMAWLVLVLSIGAILMYMLLIRRGAIAKLSTLFYLVPPCTALIAWFLFGETLTFVQIAGMAVTVGGVAIATRTKG
jgi:drug/metabolite transporter (DMT)-like permease